MTLAVNSWNDDYYREQGIEEQAKPQKRGARYPKSLKKLIKVWRKGAQSAIRPAGWYTRQKSEWRCDRAWQEKMIQ